MAEMKDISTLKWCGFHPHCRGYFCFCKQLLNYQHVDFYTPRKRKIGHEVMYRVYRLLYITHKLLDGLVERKQFHCQKQFIESQSMWRQTTFWQMETMRKFISWLKFQLEVHIDVLISAIKSLELAWWWSRTQELPPRWRNQKYASVKYALYEIKINVTTNLKHPIPPTRNLILFGNTTVVCVLITSRKRMWLFRFQSSTVLISHRV